MRKAKKILWGITSIMSAIGFVCLGFIGGLVCLGSAIDEFKEI